MKTKFLRRALALLLLSTINYQLSTSFAQGTAITYQGRVQDNGTSFNSIGQIMQPNAPTLMQFEASLGSFIPVSQHFYFLASIRPIPILVIFILVGLVLFLRVLRVLNRERKENKTNYLINADVKPPAPSNDMQHAKMLFDKHQYQESEAEFKKLLESGPHQAEASYYMGIIRNLGGDKRAANEFFERTTVLDPNHANAFYFLGELAVASGDKTKAGAYYQKALQINPDHAGAIQRTEHPGFLSIMRRDTAPVSQQSIKIINLLQKQVHNVRPHGSAYFGKFMFRLVVCLFVTGWFVNMLKQMANVAGNAANINLPHGIFSSIGSLPLTLVSTLLFLLAAVLILQPPKLQGYVPIPPCEKGFLRVFAPIILMLLFSLGNGDIAWDTCGLGIGFSVLVYILYYALWISALRYSFNEGRLTITSGVFSKEFETIELYRVLDLEVRQTFLNRITKDGSIVLYVEGVNGVHGATPITLTGVAKIDELRQIFDELRNLVILLRSSTWGKGVIY